ncbi:conserved domain protein [delta proteobacterium NaphS2]|nr:conserved domain protein [delta proteobacterium NaphS2]
MGARPEAKSGSKRSLSSSPSPVHRVQSAYPELIGMEAIRRPFVGEFINLAGSPSHTLAKIQDPMGAMIAAEFFDRLFNLPCAYGTVLLHEFF